MTLSFSRDGCELFPGHGRDLVASCLRSLPESGNQRHLLTRHPALRPVLKPLWGLAEKLAGEPVELCRSLLFDKVPGANWKVGVHQDVTLACGRRFEAPGWGPWSEKEGVPHVQPPLSVLEAMVSLRLHLDPCGSENGPLRVVPGSHADGRLSSAQLATLSADGWCECAAAAGDVLALRPLLVHASSPSSRPGHRRVVHLEFAARSVLPAAWTSAEKGDLSL